MNKRIGENVRKRTEDSFRKYNSDESKRKRKNRKERNITTNG